MEIDAINDYKSTAMTIICSSILIVVICITLPLPSLNESVLDAIILWTVMAFLVVIVHLGFTFIPKVSLYIHCHNAIISLKSQFVALYRDPQGNNIFTDRSNTTVTHVHII